MNKNKSISLVIPVFNNDQTLKRYLQESYKILEKFKVKFEIILCDDGSVDKSYKIMTMFANKHKNVHIIKHGKNVGIAKSLQDLYSSAKNKYIVLFSADGGWNSLDIYKLIYFAFSNNADIVIGRRRKKRYTLNRALVSSLYNFLPRLLFGKNLYDVGSIKLFRKDIYTKIKTNSKSVFFEAEMFIKALNSGYNIYSVSVTHKKTHKKNKSGVNYKIVINSFLDMIKLRLSF